MGELLDDHANQLKIHPLRNSLEQLYLVKKASFSDTHTEAQNLAVGIVTLK